MKGKYVVVGVGICVLMVAYSSYVPSQPSFNGPIPGCGATGCHTFQSGILSVQALSNLQVRVTLTGTADVAGELVDSTGTVVAVNDLTSTNPFILTAPRTGRYTVNAGFKNPQRRWDSTQVVLSPPTGIDDQESGTAGATFRLDQNYPNPFNPSSTIDFAIPHSAFVTLKLYSLEGQEVMTLVSRPMHLGKHSVRLDAGSLSSGVYIYRLQARLSSSSVGGQAGDFVQTRKLMLLR